MKLRIRERDGKYTLEEKDGFDWRFCYPDLVATKDNRHWSVPESASWVPTLDEAVAWASAWREKFCPKKTRDTFYKV